MNLRNMPGPGDEATWGPVLSPQDPRYVAPPATREEIEERATELQIEAFWNDEQRFYDAMECAGCVENVYPNLRRALVALGEYPRNPYALNTIIESLKAARKELEDFDTAIIDDEYIEAAEDELHAT